MTRWHVIKSSILSDLPYPKHENFGMSHVVWECQLSLFMRTMLCFIRAVRLIDGHDPFGHWHYCHMIYSFKLFFLLDTYYESAYTTSNVELRCRGWNSYLFCTILAEMAETFRFGQVAITRFHIKLFVLNIGRNNILHN